MLLALNSFTNWNKVFYITNLMIMEKSIKIVYIFKLVNLSISTTALNVLENIPESVFEKKKLCSKVITYYFENNFILYNPYYEMPHFIRCMAF